jgi:hypothetical protein
LPEERKIMPGKYSHLKNSLTKFTPEPEYQQRVNAKKDEIRLQLELEDRPLSTRSIGEIYVRARQEKERLEALEKVENLMIEACNQMLVEMMEGESFTSVKLLSGISITLKDDVYVTVKDKTAFHAWIRETNLEDLLTVNYQTMSAMVKNKLIDGEVLPPGVDTYFKQSVTMRGGKIDG